MTRLQTTSLTLSVGLLLPFAHAWGTGPAAPAAESHDAKAAAPWVRTYDKGPEAASREELDAAAAEAALNEEVVTASGTQEARSMASANVFSIGAREIAQRGYRSLAEILADVPGLYVLDDHVLPSVGVRGISGGVQAGTRIVKMMINGVQVNFRPMLTAFIGPEYIPVEMIDRVEVAKGPLSALYGANAFLATVNVITRRGGTGATHTIEAGLRTNYVSGTEDTARNLKGGGKVGAGGSLVAGFEEGNSVLFAAVTGDYVNRSGLQAENLRSGQMQPGDRLSKNDIASPEGLYVNYRRVSDRYGTVNVQGGIQLLDASGEFQLNSVLTDTTRYSMRNDWFSIGYDVAWSKSLSSAATFSFSHGEPTRDEVLYTSNNNYYFKPNFFARTYEGSISVTAAPASWLTFKVGGDADYEQQQVLFYTQFYNAQQGKRYPGDSVERIASTEDRMKHLSDFGAYAQATLVPGGVLKGLALTLNGRFDAQSYDTIVTAKDAMGKDVPRKGTTTVTEPSWRAALAYPFSKNVTAKVIAGRAFQTPSAVLLYAHSGFGANYNILGNLTTGDEPLKPQTVTSVEGVVSLQLLRGLSFELSLFGQRVNDSIEFFQTATNFQARNMGRIQNYGLEVTGNWVYGRFSLLGSVALQRRLLDSADTAAGVDPNIPSLYPVGTGLLGANFAVPEAYVNLNGRLRWVGRRGASQSNVELNNLTFYSQPAYATLDLGISSLGLNVLGGTQTTLSVNVRNVFDTRYWEPGFAGVDIPSLGRTWIVELRQSL